MLPEFNCSIFLLLYLVVYTVGSLSLFISFLYLNLYLLGDDTSLSKDMSCQPNVY